MTFQSILCQNVSDRVFGECRVRARLFRRSQSRSDPERDHFAATIEREGSEIVRQIVSPLLDNRARMVSLMHFYELMHRFYRKDSGDALFLHTERQADGVRIFKPIEGKPLPTSFGEDLYNSIFGGAPGHDGAAHIKTAGG